MPQIGKPRLLDTIRRVWPDVFADRAEQSRRIGAKLVQVNGQRVFLDELKSDDVGQIEMNFDCGVFCEEPEKVA